MPRKALGMEAKLTPRQHTILVWIAKGLSQREVAEKLGIDPKTVRSHLSTAYKELRVGSAIEAFNKLGWLSPPEEV